MPAVIFGPVMVLMGLWMCVASATGYVEHLAAPPVELDLAAHDLSMHVWGFAGGLFCTLCGMWATVQEHRERKRNREDERKWEEMYERTPPVPPHGQVVR